MNRTERLTGILLLLQERPRTAQEIARHYEISRRTVLRDMQALGEIGVPLIAREGAGGGYSLPDDYTLSPLALTAHEAFLLLLALRPLSQLGQTPFAEARASLLTKLQAVLPAHTLADVEQLLAVVDMPVPGRDQRAPHLDALLAAAQAGRWVRVTYQSPRRATTLHLLPRRVTLRGGLWYCQAYTHEHGETRTYRVDRIQALNAPEPDFNPGPTLPERDYHDPSHPEVVVTLSASAAADLEAELDASMQPQPNGDDTLTLRFHCPPREYDWYARQFAGLGQGVVVHAPPALRQRLAEIGQQLVSSHLD